MKTLALPLALAAAAIAGPAFAQTSPILPDGALLEVSAEGEVTRTPDVATIRAGVTTQADTAAAATADNAQRMARVVAALKAAGVADRDLMTSNVALSPRYRYADNVPPVITGYQASNGVSIRFRDVARSGRILDALVKQGANEIAGPSFSLDKPEAALDEARTLAIVRARARADLYAKAAGLRVERIVSITESSEDRGGSPQPMMAMTRMKGAEAADTQVLAGETAVVVRVQVKFLLK